MDRRVWRDSHIKDLLHIIRLLGKIVVGWDDNLKHMHWQTCIKFRFDYIDQQTLADVSCSLGFQPLL